MTDIFMIIWGWILYLKWLIVLTAGVVGSSLLVYLLNRHKIPKLKYDGFWVKKNESGLDEERYFIKVSRKGGETEAKEVSGYVGIKNKLGLKKGSWLGEVALSSNVNIPLNKYLILFKTFKRHGKTIITFQGVDYDPNKPDFRQRLEKSLYESYMDDKLIIEIDSDRGRIRKKHLEKKIVDIVNEAKVIPP